MNSLIVKLFFAIAVKVLDEDLKLKVFQGLVLFCLLRNVNKDSLDRDKVFNGDYSQGSSKE